MAKRAKWFVYAPACEPGLAFIEKMTTFRSKFNNPNFVIYGSNIPTKKVAYQASRHIRVASGYR